MGTMASRPADVLRFIGRSSKRITVTVVGGALVALGLVLLVLPGPGILVVAIGFAVLGTEYAWAAAALERTKKAAEQAGRVARRSAVKVARGASNGVRAAGRKVRRRPASSPNEMAGGDT
jgi:hypothetical protein